MHAGVGVDWGQNRSGHAFVAAGVTENFSRMVVLGARRLPARGATPNDALRMLEGFCAEIAGRHGEIRAVCCDGAEQTMLNLVKRSTALPARNARKRPIVDRIRMAVGLMASGRLWFMAGAGAGALREFFREARYKEGAERDERLDDGSYPVDAGDAFEYAIEAYMGRMAVGGVAAEDDEEDGGAV